MKIILKIIGFIILNVSIMINVFGQKKGEEIKVGSQVPLFTLPDQDGKMFNLKDYIGKTNLVIYFYPADDTPGCTKEACHFRDLYDDFNKANAKIIGISAQSPESHRKFIKKYNLNFTLLADEDGKVRKMFGAKGSLGGMIPGRVTFVVDKSGKIIYVFNSQSEPAKHVDEALRILNEGRK
jgi:thioredoxin-dependent peroxiredoxin